MVEFKGTALKYLNNNPLLHACMIDSINRGASHVLYAAEDGALAYDAAAQTHMPVSYTHLDVYKRQPRDSWDCCLKAARL